MKARAAVSALVFAICACQKADRSQPRFRDAAEQTALVFHHFTGATGAFYMPEIMGAGGALLDYDNDGDLDVYLIQGTLLAESRRPARALFPLPAGQKPGNRLFRNELIPSGTLRFTDVTIESGTGQTAYGMGAATGDYDNDGYVDLYVTNFGPNVLYHNKGNGSFQDVTATAEVDDPRWSTAAAFLDYDRDGDLDLFVLNYVDFTVAGNKPCFSPAGERDYCTPKAYRPVPARLFRNDGSGHFTDVSASSGIAASYGPGLGVMCADFDGDGWLDIYVANDTAANLLWVNQRDGTFREKALETGLAYSEDGLPKAGMGVAAGDFDQDRDEDVLVLNLAREGATLWQRDGSTGFQDISLRTGLKPLTVPYTGFGVGWFDYDNDGWLDLFLANGAVTRIERQMRSAYPFAQKNQLLRNLGGARLLDVTGEAGPGMQLVEVSRGAAFGDIDNDGDIDVLVTNNNGPGRLLLNETAPRRDWLEIRLEGVRANRMALGAIITLERAGGAPLVRSLRTDSSYLSASDPRVHFGLDQGTKVEALVIRWPDGHEQRLSRPRVNQVLSIRESR